MNSTIRLMNTADIKHGMRLKEQAGWNQVEADWDRVLALQPDGCFLAEVEGQVAGTVTTCVFGEVAWIAMMLVTPLLRGRGLGRALMSHALDFLDQAGVQSVRLDATPLGQPLYQSLGFETEYQVFRYQGEPTTIARASNEAIRSLAPSDLQALRALDHRVTATNRSKLLQRVAAESEVCTHIVKQGDRLAGFVMTRPGANAFQVGPCLGDQQAGATLLSAALMARVGRDTLVDIIEAHAASRAVAETHGLRPVRTFARMGRGLSVREALDLLWAGFGPEMG